MPECPAISRGFVFCMVHKRVQKQLQAADTGGVATHDPMPQYMFKSPRGTGYIFRRAVPADIQQIIGKREFKQSLGGDFRSASTRCRELAVDTDKRIEEARRLAARPSAPVVSPENTIAVAGPLPPLPLGIPKAERERESYLSEAIGSRDLALEKAKTLGVSPLMEMNSSTLEELHARVMDMVTRAYRERRYGPNFSVDRQLAEISRMQNLADMATHGDDFMVLRWSPLAIHALSTIGFRLADEAVGTRHERVLAMEYARAYRDALDYAAAEYRGELNPFRSAETRPSKPENSISPPRTDAMMLSKVIKHFFDNLPQMKEMRAKHEVVLPAFLEVTSDIL